MMEKKIRKPYDLYFPKSLTEHEFIKLYRAIPPYKSYKEFKICCILAYETGMRITEIKNLTIDDFNFTQKCILIREGKMNKDRIVPLPKVWKSYMNDDHKGMMVRVYELKKFLEENES